MRVILASASPRRKELMNLIYPDYEVIVSDADEHTGDLGPAETVALLSERKARAVLDSLGECDDTVCVIGSDTVVSIGGRILGKPQSPEEAVAMLCELSGSVHEVFTGVTILVSALSSPVKKSFVSRAEVHFDEMSPEEIGSYVASGEPMDKAGAYGIQGLGAKYIKGINGDFFTVMGLPVCELYHELRKLNVIDV